MHSIPFALSISKYVDSAGADVGFASLLAVALLIILYFAHARETATLRERLDDAYTRIGNLEARVQQLVQLQQLRAQQPQASAQQAQARPGVTPAPVVARPMGTAAASVRRIPANGPVPAAVANGLLPAALAGLGAPALASATKLVPDPAAETSEPVAAPSVAQDTMLVPGVAAASAPVTAAAGTPAAAAPPRVQIRPEGPNGDGARRPGAPPRQPAGQPRRFLEEPPPRRREWGRALLVGFGGLVAVAAVVVVLLALTSSGSPSKPKAATTTTKTTVDAFKPSKVVVAVLNGTGISGLAGDVSKYLTNHGFKPGSVTDAAVQGQSVTDVLYVPNVPNSKTDAQHVAGSLKVKPTRVRAARESDIQSCETSLSGATTSCTAAVIVTVGSDKASFASSSS